MTTLTKRTTIYLDPELHRALRLKSAETNRSISELINELVKMEVSADEADLRAFRERVDEPTISYEALLQDLKAHGKI
ncbi:MAG: ribbon-helix-helix protein, CopG family [Anaerolineae bacterium]|nr:ribbon-helix-helix protein, CopG family [Anaerolineae bacterium]MCO5188221.1 ribbon-helix-helix protein, CopG family [Anaerolineae bacterium]MCO5194209.1 ribbon-helix-helix protein, CopG family [Anaerolineae bacterium]MCO5200043.1 ribbon-helix-helix protein, CopG family [Anaerolineae bacterium]MCO5204713.1 ribbon-helix-helix protein, CopG family [Anaerolineae bacterium]